MKRYPIFKDSLSHFPKRVRSIINTIAQESTNFFIQAVQTPKQRIANEKYYKKHEKQRGKAKPAAKKELPISKGWFSKWKCKELEIDGK